MNVEEAGVGRAVIEFKSFLFDYKSWIKEEAVAAFKIITNHSSSS
jgi:hypothetical protein